MNSIGAIKSDENFTFVYLVVTGHKKYLKKLWKSFYSQKKIIKKNLKKYVKFSVWTKLIQNFHTRKINSESNKKKQNKTD